MPIDVDEVFRELTPPPGGAAKLRTLLAAERGRRHWLPVFALAAPAAVAAALVVVIALPPRPAATVDATIVAALNPAVLRYLRPTVDDDSSSAVSIPASQQHAEAVKRVGNTPDDVLFFWVASVAAPEPG